MAETGALCFSTLSSSLTSTSRSKETFPSLSPSPLTSLVNFSLLRPQSLSSFVHFRAKASNSGNYLGDDPFGFYPWDSSDEDGAIQWVPEERITLFTADGLIQIGGSMVPRRIPSSDGLDASRRLCILGFCRSIEMLSDAVEDTVLEHGGEIVAAEKASKGGLHEKLTMTVAVPLLWGVPPASETLHLAVQSGGGIVEKVYWQWDFL
ncbi:uncharacterized protein LOC132293387 isoform X2 [Cornus florida]|uniref:uncharacterized protein LOC132293387 isoform X2 n=1 Tax=Cornus florida TaxID=4283 RepID=UPI0028A260F5|nr:uncharacterized protein LOC132293387 isoform X2 [Cornus florida]